MQAFIATQKELEETVSKAVFQAVSKVLPEVFRQMQKHIYTNDEATKLLGVSKRHLQYLRDTEQINYVQNGRKIYYRAEDLEHFFNANQINVEVQNG